MTNNKKNTELENSEKTIKESDKILKEHFEKNNPGVEIIGSDEEPLPPLPEIEEKPVSKEAVARKRKSEIILTKQHIPLNPYLPIIEDSTEVKIRSKEEICYRAMCLCLVAVKAEGIPQEVLLEVVEKYGLKEHFSPEEKQFIYNETPVEQEIINFIWRYEAYFVMLWALKYVDKLDKPNTVCDVVDTVPIIQTRTTEEFIEDAKMRSASEILDEADLIYRYHWATEEARINNDEPPEDLEPDVIYERHYALNWLIGYMGQDWDDITTDT